MPKNYSAYIRYLVINRMLSNGRRATFEQIKDACERALDIYPLGKRTIEKDIERMRYDSGLNFRAPIENDRRTGEYYYEDPDYSIDRTSLSEEEIISVVFTTQLLAQFKELDVFKTFQGTVQKLIDAAEVYMDISGTDLQDKIEFEHTPEAKGNEHLELVMQALGEKTVLRMSYRSFYAEKDKIHILHPYYLKEYRNRWYLIGYHEQYKGIRTFSLDRISSLEPEHGLDFIDTGFVADEFYKNIVGVTVPEDEPFEIKLAATKEQARYIITQPLHDSQELIEEKEDEVIFKYFLSPTFEFQSQILGWGDQVKVLEPAEFRNQVVQSLRDTLSKYGD